MYIDTFFKELIDKNIKHITGVDLNKTIAKTSGITLLEHTRNVENECMFLLKKRNDLLNIERNRNFNIDDLKKSIYLHDIGKSFLTWQIHAKNNNLKEVNFRHEFAFLPFYFNNKNLNENYHIISAISAHHQNLSINVKSKTKIFKTDEYLKNLYKKFNIKNNINEILNIVSKNKELINFSNEKYKEIINLWYNQVFYRHFLQLSDKRASIKESYDVILPEPQKFEYKFRYDTYRSTQKIILENSNELITFLRAPAGGGKSDAGFLWAQEQINNKKCDRVIFTLPTIFTSNVMAKNISKDIKGTSISNSTSKFTNKQNSFEFN
jgi:hypothetical protein